MLSSMTSRQSSVDDPYWNHHPTSGEVNTIPSKGAKQHRLMAAAAHDPAFARKVGISQSVAREFVAADKKKKTRRKKGY